MWWQVHREGRSRCWPCQVDGQVVKPRRALTLCLWACCASGSSLLQPPTSVHLLAGLLLGGAESPPSFLPSPQVHERIEEENQGRRANKKKAEEEPKGMQQITKFFAGAPA